MVVNFDQLVTVVKPPVIDPGSVGRVGDNHQGIIKGFAVNVIHRSNPVKTWNMLSYQVNLLVREGGLQNFAEPHLGADGIRVRPLVPVNDNFIVLFDLFKNLT